MKLVVKDLSVEVNGKIILENFNMEVLKGDVVAIMGPNGSGKSTFSKALMGHPKYEVVKGTITVDGKNVLEMSVDKRANLGIFLGFQNPLSIEGLKFSTFLYQISKKSNPELRVLDFKKKLNSYLQELRLDKSFVERDLNLGFSGGEKKKAEALQLLMSEAKLIILDEIDSGLDVDSMKLISELIKRHKGEDVSLILITHYQRLLNYIKPNKVFVLVNGKIIKQGDEKLAKKIEEEGYRGVSD